MVIATRAYPAEFRFSSTPCKFEEFAKLRILDFVGMEMINTEIFLLEFRGDFCKFPPLLLTQKLGDIEIAVFKVCIKGLFTFDSSENRVTFMIFFVT